MIKQEETWKKKKQKQLNLKPSLQKDCQEDPVSMKGNYPLSASTAIRLVILLQDVRKDLLGLILTDKGFKRTAIMFMKKMTMKE